MSETFERDKKEWTSPSVTRHGDATEIIHSKWIGGDDGTIFGPTDDTGVPIGSNWAG